MPLSTEPLTLIDVPPWRRVRVTASARIKHWFGVHTYIETLYGHATPEGVAWYETNRECWVCGRLA